MQKLQIQLQGEKQDKSDDSPVTIADYGQLPAPTFSVEKHDPCLMNVLGRPQNKTGSGFCHKNSTILALSCTPRAAHVNAGSQALVAYSLQQSLPNVAFSMVAEEDSADLRQVHV